MIGIWSAVGSGVACTVRDAVTVTVRNAVSSTVGCVLFRAYTTLFSRKRRSDRDWLAIRRHKVLDHVFDEKASSLVVGKWTDQTKQHAVIAARTFKSTLDSCDMSATLAGR